MPTSHGPNYLRNYVEIHETVMGQFAREGFVESDTLEIVSAGKGLLHMEGEVLCVDGLVCTVDKWLEIVDEVDPDNPRVRTLHYNYNVSVRGVGNLFRYDNADHHGHPDPHHRHAFDWRTGQQLAGSPKWIGADYWPTLGDVIREACEWYWEHSAELAAAR